MTQCVPSLAVQTSYEDEAMDDDKQKRPAGRETAVATYFDEKIAVPDQGTVRAIECVFGTEISIEENKFCSQDFRPRESSSLSLWNTRHTPQ